MTSAHNNQIDEPHSVALHRFAVLCAAATFILIFVGGLVTSTGSALAVPDWPLAYGRLIPKLVGGVRFEYGHRVVAGVVVMLTIVLAIWIAMVERRSWVRKTAFAAAGLIVLQAILGGITVLYLLPLPIAVAHAGTAQALFCLMVAMALFTNPKFGAGPRLSADDRTSAAPSVLATTTTAIIYIQILIGAVMRHLGAGLAIPDFPTSFGHWMPPFAGIGIDVNFAHRCGAVVVSIMVLWTAARIFSRYRDRPELTHPGAASDRAFVAAGFARRDDDMVGPRGAADHGACSGWRGSAGNQSCAHDSRFVRWADWHRQRKRLECVRRSRPRWNAR